MIAQFRTICGLGTRLGSVLNGGLVDSYIYIYNIFLDLMVELVCGGSVINGAYLVLLESSFSGKPN